MCSRWSFLGRTLAQSLSDSLYWVAGNPSTRCLSHFSKKFLEDERRAELLWPKGVSFLEANLGETLVRSTNHLRCSPSLVPSVLWTATGVSITSSGVVMR